MEAFQFPVSKVRLIDVPFINNFHEDDALALSIRTRVK